MPTAVEELTRVEVPASAYELFDSGEDDGWFIRLDAGPTLRATRRRTGPRSLLFTAAIEGVPPERKIYQATVVRDNIDYWTVEVGGRPVDGETEIRIEIYSP